MSKYFGTDGFRGEANVGLTVEHAYRIGRFLGWYYGREHKCSVVIGKDTRRSSYMFENALSAGLTASGADAYLMHVTTTPSVSYIVRSDDFDCGIMISASHNPFTDNGIKLLNSAGEKMEQSVIDEIENYLDGNLEIPFATGANIGRTQDYSAGRNRYIGYLISLSTHSYKGMKVGLDCANGSTWMMAKNIFDALGADTYVIGNEPDGTNINRDCGSTHIENLQKYVRLNRLDVGFAFDGDADRCLAVDENGSVVNGDKILYVCARNMQTEGRFGNSKVVTTVMSNLGLYKALDEAGIGYEKTDVGDKYVAENMRANGHLIGGEQSGHIIFGKYANTGDGLLTAIIGRELGLPPERIHIAPADTDYCVDSGSTAASRGTITAGNAAWLAAQEAKQQINTALWEYRGFDGPIVYEDGLVRCGDEQMTFTEAVGVLRNTGRDMRAHGWWAAPKTFWDREKCRGSNYMSYAYGACGAEVEIDPITGKTDVTDFVAVHDMGRIVNHAATVGQVGGGVSMGVGYALTENADTPGGVTRAADLDSYLLPTALDMCPVRTVLLEEGAGVPPLLVHGIGEPATSIVAPAITNAMSAALGARIDTLPADLETVRAILDEKKR